MSKLRGTTTTTTTTTSHEVVAEARRFPEVAASVSRIAQEGWAETVAELLAALAGPDKLPAFAADRRVATARHFIELTMLPMVMRALFDDEPRCNGFISHDG